LELVRAAIRESGISSAIPTSVENQTGQTLLVVNAVATAYNRIQERHSTWLWLLTEFSTTSISTITPPTEARYTALSFGIARFADWARDIPAKDYYPFSIYLTATGLSDESRLRQIPFQTWKAKYGTGVQTTAKPTEWAVDNQMQFCLGKFPNGAYTLRGEYRKGNQSLSANSDEPEMPSRFHYMIVWLAALMLTEQDEADTGVYARLENKYNEMLGQLERDQLPVLEIAGTPIA
jgi:hypothetical protein